MLRSSVCCAVPSVNQTRRSSPTQSSPTARCYVAYLPIALYGNEHVPTLVYTSLHACARTRTHTMSLKSRPWLCPCCCTVCASTTAGVVAGSRLQPVRWLGVRKRKLGVRPAPCRACIHACVRCDAMRAMCAYVGVLARVHMCVSVCVRPVHAGNTCVRALHACVPGHACAHGHRGSYTCNGTARIISCVCACMCMCTCLPVRVCVHVHACARAHVCARVRSRARACVCVCVQTRSNKFERGQVDVFEVRAAFLGAIQLLKLRKTTCV